MKITTFKNYNEAFNNPFKWKLKSSSEGKTSYSFQDDERDVFVVEFNNLNDKKDTTGERLSGVNLSFDKGGSWNLDAGGQPFRVFATIYDILKDYNLSGEDYLEIGMDKSESRNKLYTAMMKKLQKEFKMPHWSIEKANGYTFITISRMKIES